MKFCGQNGPHLLSVGKSEAHRAASHFRREKIDEDIKKIKVTKQKIE